MADKRKRSTVRHTRAIQRDRTKRPASVPTDEAVEQRLSEIIHPATLGQVSYFHQLGLRERMLNLPVMMALVLSLIWRQISGVCELVRMIHTESLLWATPRKVSQQALSERLNSLPAELFVKVLTSVLPVLHERWLERTRPLPLEIAWAREHYTQVALCDGSTLDALIRKIGLLRDLATPPLAGRMSAVLDLCSRLPLAIWHEVDEKAHDLRFWERIVSALQPGALLIFDLGYTDFANFMSLTARHIAFITRAKSNLVYQVERTLRVSATVHDRIVWIGSHDTRQQVRLIEVLYHGLWYRYLTNELDDHKLPTPILVALYWQRWRIEDAFNIVKRLLGLAYFWGGSPNAVQLQVWATWMLYAVLVDLTDAVAEQLNQPFAAVSMEMVYRSLYFFTQAFHRGEASDVVVFLAHNAKLFGILKRKPRLSNVLNL